MSQDYYTEQRPWGQFKILFDTPTFKVKEMTIRPGQRLSYQLHHKRAEHCFVLVGVGVVTLDGREIIVNPGQSVDVPVESKHRVANRGIIDLVYIEIQTGTYFGEDDIIRFEDDYSRVS